MNLHICDIDKTLIDSSHREDLLAGWRWSYPDYWAWLTEQFPMPEKIQLWRELSMFDGFTPLMLNIEGKIRDGDSLALVTNRFEADARQARATITRRLGVYISSSRCLDLFYRSDANFLSGAEVKTSMVEDIMNDTGQRNDFDQVFFYDDCIKTCAAVKKEFPSVTVKHVVNGVAQ